jgi:predicted nuclease of predicted toxin-antitoxin system
MRFLVDNALSPVVAQKLREEGHDAIHTREIGMAAASDPIVFDRAADDERILISADTDFGTLLAMRESTKPSVILFRREDHRPPSQVSRLIAELPNLSPDLEKGAMIVIEDARVRIRPLPILRHENG